MAETHPLMPHKWFRYSSQFKTFYFHHRYSDVIFPIEGITAIQAFLSRKLIRIQGKSRGLDFIHKEDVSWKVMESGMLETVIVYRDTENGIYLINVKGIAVPW